MQSVVDVLSVYCQLLHMSSVCVKLTMHHQCMVAQTSAPARICNVAHRNRRSKIADSQLWVMCHRTDALATYLLNGGFALGNLHAN